MELDDDGQLTKDVSTFLVVGIGASAGGLEALEGFFDNLPELHSAHAAAKAITRENAAKAPPAPLHPGAEKYYREVGLIK